MHLYVTALRHGVTKTDTDRSDAYDRDRGRGILTGNDWDLLVGSDDGQHNRQNRRRLRQRVRNALLDFRVLFENWDPAERDQAFVRETSDDRRHNVRENATGTIHADKEVHDACVALMGLLYEQYRSPTVNFPNETFRNLLVEGIENALKTTESVELSEVVLEIDTENRLVTEARNKYERGESVSYAELTRLMENGIVSPDNIPLCPPHNGGHNAENGGDDR